MKWLFGVLLLLNLALLGMGAVREERGSEPPQPAAVTNGIPPLRLVAEIPTLQAGGGVSGESASPGRPVDPPPPPEPAVAPPPAKQTTPAVKPAPQPPVAAIPMVVAPTSSPAPARGVVAAPLVVAAAASPDDTPSPIARCHTMGPFSREYLADRAKGRAEGFGIKVSQRSELTEQQVGYWIYLPPYTSRAKAQEATRALASKGIDDYFIINTEPMENAISLGVYKNRDGADRRVAEVAARGFSPTIQPRVQPATHYWLDLVGIATPVQWRDLDAEYPAQRRKEIACE
jgi:hypothetical protein